MMGKRWQRLVGGLALALWLACAVAITAGQVQATGVLAFIAPVNLAQQLFVVDVQSRLLHQVTNFESHSVYKLNAPHWSPDGREIALEYWRGADVDIVNYDLPTREMTTLYQSEASNRSPRWSPDGTRILFTKLEDNAAALYLVDPATQQAERIHDLPYYFNFHAYAWSPDSRYIAYYFRRMFVLDTHTSDTHELAAGYEFEDLEQLIWSPDSCCVIFTAPAPGARGRNPPRHIYRADVITGEIQPILNNPVHEFRPHLLQGQDVLIYQSFDPRGQVRRLDLTNGESTPLMEMKSTDLMFSPDGRYAAYLRIANPSEVGSNEQLWVEDLRTGASFPLTPPELAPRAVVWRR